MAMSLTGRGLNRGAIVGFKKPSVGLKSADGITFAPDDDAESMQAVQSFIGRQLNIDVMAKREKKLIQAMTDPTNWEKDRDALFTKMKTDLARYYETQLAQFYTAGYSLEQAQAFAEEATNRILPNELQKIELLHPGSNTLYANSAFTMEERNAKFNIRRGAEEGGVDKKAIYKEERARRKAKKGKSKQITA